MTNLDRLEALRAAATQKPWECDIPEPKEGDRYGIQMPDGTIRIETEELSQPIDALAALRDRIATTTAAINDVCTRYRPTKWTKQSPPTLLQSSSNPNTFEEQTVAKKTIIEYVDDLDGKKVELDDLVIKEFTIDGVVYRLEVRVSNAEKFDAQLAKWVGAATRVGGRKNTRSKIVGGGSPDQTKAIREWASANGYSVSSRGRISADIVEAFEAAH